MANYILRVDNGLIKNGDRCKDEPRYTYFIRHMNTCDEITHCKEKATRFTEDEVKKGIEVALPDYVVIKVKK